MRTLLATFALLIPTTLATGPQGVHGPRVEEPMEANAEDDERYVSYGASGGWSIVIDAQGEPECFAMGRFRSGSTMRFGIDTTTTPQSVYIVVSDPKWKGMRRDTDYPLEVSFDEAPGTALTATSGEADPNALTFRFTDPALATRFARAARMVVSRKGEIMARIMLGDPKAALMEMGTCRRDMTVLMEALRDEVEEDSPEDPIA